MVPFLEVPLSTLCVNEINGLKEVVVELRSVGGSVRVWVLSFPP